MKCQSCGKEIDRSVFPGELTFCPYCGDKLEAAANFCPRCGKKLSAAKAKEGGEDKDFLEDTAKTIARKIRNTFGRERKIKKLYQQWAEFSDLPPEEVPTIDELKRISVEEKARGESRPDEDED